MNLTTGVTSWPEMKSKRMLSPLMEKLVYLITVKTDYCAAVN
jgi:hypothetical protein